MAYVKGTIAEVHYPAACRVKSVILTPPDANRTVISLYHGQDQSRDPELVIVTTGGSTTVITFDGVSFRDGFTAVPDTDVTFFAVEYESEPGA